MTEYKYHISVTVRFNYLFMNEKYEDEETVSKGYTVRIPQEMTHMYTAMATAEVMRLASYESWYKYVTRYTVTSECYKLSKDRGESKEPYVMSHSFVTERSLMVRREGSQ